MDAVQLGLRVLDAEAHDSHGGFRDILLGEGSGREGEEGMEEEEEGEGGEVGAVMAEGGGDDHPQLIRRSEKGNGCR